MPLAKKILASPLVSHLTRTLWRPIFKQAELLVTPVMEGSRMRPSSASCLPSPVSPPHSLMVVMHLLSERHMLNLDLVPVLYRKQEVPSTYPLGISAMPQWWFLHFTRQPYLSQISLRDPEEGTPSLPAHPMKRNKLLEALTTLLSTPKILSM